MALQAYSDDHAKALALLPQLTPEEKEQREKEAVELDKKLRYIVENVPDRAYHVMGSNAGAGSSEFHKYRHSRRREQERQSRMEADFQAAQKRKELEEKVTSLAEADEQRTAKRREKRQKKKAKAVEAKAHKAVERGQDAVDGNQASDASAQAESTDVVGEEPALDLD